MIDLKTIEQSSNLTPELDEQELYKIAHSVVKGYNIDCESRNEWEETIDKAMDIAKQVVTPKNFPWTKSSNIKLPIITEAAINFASRVIPELIPNDKIVQFAIQGKDPTLEKLQRGQRVENCMSYQQLSSPDWTKGVASLMHILPVVGTVFKKTYYSEIEKRNISEVCNPKDVVVNYNTKSLATARRITHKITLSMNDIIERQRREIFNEDVLIDDLRPQDNRDADEDFEVELLEQHCWLDLDDDGYREPYVVTVHEKSLKVLRIVACIDYIEKYNGKVAKICQEQYFTDFHFILSPDGGFYSLGFGHLLLPLNVAANTLTNQQIDSGTLSVTQGGLLGRGLRIKDGEYRFKPYEYKVVDAAPGTKIADNVYQFPVREPSSVLLNLLSFLIDMSDRLTKSTEAMGGSGTGSNVSRGTMNQMIEQGSKIFSAIFSRVLDSMSSEYRKLYKLNYYYLTNKEYKNILDDELADVKKDFELESNDVRPIADPIYSSIEQRLSKITVLMNLRTADPRAVDAYILQTLKFDENQMRAFLPPPDPNARPPAKDQKDMAQAQLAASQAKVAELQAMILTQTAPLDLQKAAKEVQFIDAQIGESAMRTSKMQSDVVHGDQKLYIAGTKMQQQETLKQVQQQHKQSTDMVNAGLKNKDLELKAAESAAKIALEAKKIDKETNNNGDRSE